MREGRSWKIYKQKYILKIKNNEKEMNIKIDNKVINN